MAFPVPSTTSTALVTGASSGIGAEIAAQLGAMGWHVTLVARRQAELDRVAKLVVAAGGSATPIAADLGDHDDRVRLVDKVRAGDRSVAVLVNNAGKSTLGPVSGADVDDELSMLALNIDAVVHLSVAFVGAMVSAGDGAVLNVASTAAFQPIPGQAGYGGTKAFVLSYTEAMRADIAGSGVHVTTLCPGPVDTGFGEAAGFDKDAAEAALPKIMWVPADEVAKVGIDGMRDNKMVVIPGAANRVSSIFGHLLPKTALLPLIASRSPALKK